MGTRAGDQPRGVLREATQLVVDLRGYLVAILAVLAAGVAIWEYVQDLRIVAGVIGAPLALIALRAWLRPRPLPPPPETRFRLEPWGDSAEDRERYDRPDNAHNAALQWVLASNEPFLYLTGESGVGKSSMLAACVVPRLHEGDAVFPVATRTFRDPVGQITEALQRPGVLWKSPPAPDADPRAMLERAAARCRSEHGKRLLIVIDQFEELLRQDGQGQPESPHAEQARACLELFRSHAERPVENLSILLSLRHDWIGNLTEAGLPAPSLAHNWTMLQAFDRAPAARYLVENGVPDEHLARHLIDRAMEVDEAGGRVRPITVNIAGRIATQLTEAAHRLAPRRGTGERLFRAFVIQSLGRGQPGDERLRTLQSMITPAGDRTPPVAEADLAKACKIERRVVQRELLDLQTHGLVRTAAGGWEVSHDFVARLLNRVVERSLGSWLRQVRRVAIPVGLVWLLSVGGAAWLWRAQQLAGWEREFVELGCTVDEEGNARMPVYSLGAVRWVAHAHPGVSVINLSWTAIPDDALRYLAAHCSPTSLNLESCEQITDDALKHLAASASLTSLNLTHCYQITDAGVARLKAAGIMVIR